MTDLTLWTIGHSNHNFDKFLGLLKGAGIDTLIDVRSKPQSRWPQYGRDNLRSLIRGAGMEYYFAGSILGGKSLMLVTNPLFVDSMGKVVTKVEQGRRVAMMCSEGKPCECHRAGKLTAWVHRNRKDVTTRHILTDGSEIDALPYEPKVLATVWTDDYKQPT